MSGQALVLNVDDHEANRHLKTFLLQEGGFDVIEASSGLEALARVAADRPQVVLLDICLGDMDGYEVCRQIRARPDTEWIAVVHVTAQLISSEDWRNSVMAGANSYLTYPMNTPMLIGTIQALVHRQNVERMGQVERDRLRAQREAREHLYRSLLEQSVAGVYAIQHRRFTFVNAALAEMLGSSIDALLALPSVLAVVHPDDQPKVIAAFQQRESGERLAIRHIFRARKGDGGWAVLETHGTHGLYEGQSAVMGLAIDRTRRDQLEEQLRQSQKMDAIGQLAGGIAHDFNNQLMAILGYCGMALEQIDADKPLHADLREIEKAAQSATVLTNKLLSFGRRQLVQLEAVDLNVVAQSAADLLKRLLPDNVILELALRTGLDAVTADRVQLEQMVINLVLNARDAMPHGGHVTITTGNGEPGQLPASLKVHRRYLELVVSDNGAGMTDDTLNHLFEPFFTTKEAGKGTGLGLATVYGTVKQLGGEVTVRSTWGQGSTFIIHLPCTDRESVQADVEERTATAVGRELILVVEDQCAVLELVSKILRRHGYQVVGAGSPAEAWKHLEYTGSPAPAMMISDVTMPGMTGIEFTRRLREQGITIPVLLMSGHAEDAQATVASLSMTKFLRKPLAPKVLLDAVREMLDTANDYSPVLH